MALVTCADCAQQVSDTAPACPRCGRPVAPVRVEQTAKKYKSMMAIGFVGCLVGFLLCFALFIADLTPIPGVVVLVGCLLLYLYAATAAWWNHG